MRAGFAGVAPRDVPVEVLRDFHDTIASSGSLPLRPRGARGRWPRSTDRVPYDRGREHEPTAIPLILDVDTGIDDALALLYAAAARRPSSSP